MVIQQKENLPDFIHNQLGLIDTVLTHYKVMRVYENLSLNTNSLYYLNGCQA